MALKASSGRNIGPFRPASRKRGARSPMRTCWSMWKLKRSFSPIAAIGEAKAASRSRIPVEKRRTRQSGIGVPRRRSVRARIA
jgi:hypothetical protein